MQKEWLNNRQPDDQGYITLVIRNSQGKIISTFRRKTEAEILDDLADAQVNANRKLGQVLGKPDRANPPASEGFSDKEKIDLGSAVVSDPTKLVDTVQTVTDRKLEAERKRDAYYRAEAEAFRADHPEYYPSEHNQVALFRRLQANSWDMTRHNLGLVLEQLEDDGELEQRPTPPQRLTQVPDGGSTEDEEEEEEADQPVHAAAPPQRRQAEVLPPARRSGLRHSDASALPPQPPPRKPLITWEQLERMGRVEYNEKMRDPRFRRAVDALGERQQSAQR